MSDMAERLSPEEMAELAALADGTLPAERRAEVEARVAASPELQQLLERQRQAVVAAQALATEEMPESLQTSVEARRRAPATSKAVPRRLVPRLGIALAAAAVAAVVAAVVLSGGPGAPTVADAARLATQTPTGPAPPSVGKPGTKLALAVDGVSFPDLTRFAGWKAVGTRTERLHGRDASVVFYRRDGRRIGYVIVGGAGLARPAGAPATVIDRVAYQPVRFDGKVGVTWRRGGRTCVLLGQASPPELLRLASWPLTPPPR